VKIKSNQIKSEKLQCSTERKKFKVYVSMVVDHEI
jgi:hypothetical protein